MMHINYKIIEANETHVDGICKIEKECFIHPWSENSVLQRINDENSKVYVAVSDDFDKKVIGWAGFQNICKEGYIDNIAVTKEMRNNGIATALIEEMIKYAEKELEFLTLEVRKSNENAIHLYEKTGFDRVGERKNYYTEPKENAVIMTRRTNRFG